MSLSVIWLLCVICAVAYCIQVRLESEHENSVQRFNRRNADNTTIVMPSWIKNLYVPVGQKQSTDGRNLAFAPSLKNLDDEPGLTKGSEQSRVGHNHNQTEGMTPLFRARDDTGLPKGLEPLVTLNDGYTMPMLALGTWLGFPSKENPIPPDDETLVEHAVTWAVKSGYRHIDTAAAFGVEDQVGRAVNKLISEGIIQRTDIFITTKLWNDRHARSEVVPALRESLTRLNMNYVDLYLIHWPIGQFRNTSFDQTDFVDTWRGMIDARDRLLTRSIGVSNFNQQQIDRLLEAGLETPSALQVEINLNLQQPELLAYCKAKDIVVMGYTPFGSLLPSKIRGDAPPPRIDDEQLTAIAAKHGKTVIQIVLRYFVEIGVVPLPKSVTKSHIEENINVFDFNLTDEDKNTLRKFDKGYRTILPTYWSSHLYYPFEENVMEPLPRSHLEPAIQVVDLSLAED